MTKYIIFVLHGYASKLSWYNPIQKVIAANYPNSKIVVPPLGMTTISVSDPDDIVAKVVRQIDQEWKTEIETNGGTPENTKVIIIGHSTGAVLARKLYVAACGENADAPFEKNYAGLETKRPWAAFVDRIILFAGMNRGWTLNAHLYNKTAFLIRIGVVLGHILMLFNITPLAFKTRRGAPFITQLRIQWLSMLRHAKTKGVGDSLTIQLLGTVDDIISPDDDIDLVTGSQFIYLEVPGSNHLNVLQMDDRLFGRHRTRVFTDALIASAEELYRMQILPVDQGFTKIDNDVTDVVFVIHGIRDTGYWTHKVARRVKAMGDKLPGRKFATETSSYGYFAMLPFLLPLVRRQKVEWLMDQYTENLAQYPNAQFSFMGHSNGTYLLAKALKEYPACRFKNVVFAGSVVESSFDWHTMVQQNRICNFFNFVASSDWVVALFPKSFQRLQLSDLGSGGFDGFSCEMPAPYQLKFVNGSHGAATDEKYWDEIANFIVHGEVTDSIHSLAVPARTPFMKVLGATAPIPFILILLFLVGIALLILKIPSQNLKIVLSVAYVWGIYLFVTKV